MGVPAGGHPTIYEANCLDRRAKPLRADTVRSSEMTQPMWEQQQGLLHSWQSGRHLSSRTSAADTLSSNQGDTLSSSSFLPMDAGVEFMRQPQQQEFGRKDHQKLWFLPTDANAKLNDDETVGASDVVLRGGGAVVVANAAPAGSGGSPIV